MKRILLSVLFILILIVLIWLVLLVFTKEPQQADYYKLPSGVPPSDVKLSKSEAVEDLSFFKQSLEENHPALYRYVSKSDLDKKIRSIQSSIESSNEITLDQFYFSLKEFTGVIDDIHTNIYAPSYKNQKILPFKVALFDNKLYIIEENTNTVIPKGSKLVSIDGYSSRELIQLLSTYANTPLKSGTEVFIQDNMMKLLPRLIGSNNEYLVEYLHDGELEKAKVFLMDSMDHESANNKTTEDIKTYLYHGQGIEIPVLKINRFSGTDFGTYKTVVDSFFEKYSDSEYCVIDIRNNTGGNSSWGNYVLNYFAPDQYKTHDRFDYLVSDHAKEKLGFEFHRRLYYKKIPSLLWDTPLYKIIPGVQALGKLMHSDNGERFSEGALYTKNTKNSEDRYKGTVYLLISERTGSAAIDFASTFKYNEMGIVVGRETYHPDSFSGNITYHVLPNSGLIFSNSVTYSIAARGNDDGRGVIPNHFVEYTIEDYLTNVDKDLETVLELVGKE